MAPCVLSLRFPAFPVKHTIGRRALIRRRYTLEEVVTVGGVQYRKLFVHKNGFVGFQRDKSEEVSTARHFSQARLAVANMDLDAHPENGGVVRVAVRTNRHMMFVIVMMNDDEHDCDNHQNRYIVDSAFSSLERPKVYALLEKGFGCLFHSG